jgi:hypothetical protein
MKHLFYIGLLLACVCYCSSTLAQPPLSKDASVQKPFLFPSLPSKFACNRLDADKLIQTVKYEHINIRLNETLVLEGEVMEKVQTTPGIENINIRLSNFENALLNISIISKPDNTKSIVGRIIHPKHSDALVIAEENGKYFVTKYKVEFFMVE